MSLMAGGFPLPGRVQLAQRMATRFGLAMGDQLMFSATSFAFAVLLGRWQSHEDFGVFSVTFSVFVLLQNVFEGLVSEPFGVFGAGRLSLQLDAYIGRLAVAHIFVAGGLAGLALLIGLALDALGQPSLAWAFVGMGLATPFLLGRILARQALYIMARVHWSALTGALHLACSLAVLIGLRLTGLLTPFSAFLALGLGGLVGSVMAALVFLNPVWRSGDPALSYRRLAVGHLGYGKWALGERAFLWLQSSSIFLVLPLVVNLHASAVYRCMTVLAVPGYMMLTAFSGIVLPALVRAQMSSVAFRRARALMPATVGMAAVYCVLLISFGEQAAHVAFAGQYDADLSTWLFVAAGAGLMFYAVSTALELQLRACEMVRHIVTARIAATLVLLVSGIPLIARFGVLGAFVIIAENGLVTAVVLAALRRYGRSGAAMSATVKATRVD